MLNKQKIATVVLEMTVKWLTKIFLALEISEGHNIYWRPTLLFYFYTCEPM